MTESDEPLEDIAAGLLNGVMVSLLGSVLPAALIFTLVSQIWRGDFDPGAFLSDAWPLIGGLLLSLLVLRTGVRLLRESGAQLIRRRTPRSND